MRALVLILTTVVLIATIEASYSTMERVARDKTENRAHKHHRNHSKTQHHGKHGGHLLKSVSEAANRLEEQHTMRDPGENNPYRPHHGKKYVDLRTAHSHKDGRLRFDLPVTKEYTVENAVSPRTHAKERHDQLRVRIERVEQPRERVVKPRSNPKHLSAENSNRKVSKSYPNTYEEISRDTLPVKKALPFSQGTRNDEGEVTKSHNYEAAKFAYKYRTGSESAHKAHVYMRASCNADSDCNGGCCVQLKNGKSRCKLPNTRDAGHKCASSCVCKSDLKCFISTFRRNGQKKMLKEGQKLLGHCMTDNMADLRKGYFLPEQTVATTVKT